MILTPAPVVPDGADEGIAICYIILDHDIFSGRVKLEGSFERQIEDNVRQRTDAIKPLNPNSVHLFLIVIIGEKARVKDEKINDEGQGQLISQWEQQFI